MVVYDQSTRDASVLATDSFLSILLSKLDGCFDSVAILTGELRGALWAAGRPVLPVCLPCYGLSWGGRDMGGVSILDAPLSSLSPEPSIRWGCWGQGSQ